MIRLRLGNNRTWLITNCYITTNRDQSRYASSQWEAWLQYNNISHWLCTYLDWSLNKAKHNKTPCIFHGIYCIYYSNEFINIPLSLFPWWNIPIIVSCYLSFVTAYNKKSSLARAPVTRIWKISLTQPGTFFIWKMSSSWLHISGPFGEDTPNSILSSFICHSL